MEGYQNFRFCRKMSSSTAPELCSVRRPGEPQTSAVEFLSSEVFGSPKEPEWAAPNFHLRLSLPRIIMDMLDVPSNSKEAVITAMRAMSKAHEAGVEYDPSGEIKAGRGAKVLIEDYTPQADVVRGEWHEPRQCDGGAEPVAAREEDDAPKHQLRVLAALRAA